MPVIGQCGPTWEVLACGSTGCVTWCPSWDQGAPFGIQEGQYPSYFSLAEASPCCPRVPEVCSPNTGPESTFYAEDVEHSR